MERRLTAILSADVVGYSRLMSANEVDTIDRLRALRGDVIDPAVGKGGGRLFKTTGDGVLVEFPSIIRAVESAVAIQREIEARNADVPDDRRMLMRIGINLGDVVIDGDDLLGDGVNIAARLESIAPVGGLALSEAAHSQIARKLDLPFRDEGKQQLKNIDRPVRVFTFVPAPAAVDARSAAGPAEKCSIAVLPFTNMSGDPEQEYFSDGMTEDLITDLSKISGLFVVGRHSSFVYKGRVDRLDRIATELGVRYLLEGSVRKAGNRIRVTGQLLDGRDGGHLWADRYDRDLDDIFAIQDELTRAIVDALKVRLVPSERAALAQAPTDNVEAYTCFLQGRDYFYNATREFLERARRMFERATALDPQFARAYAGIANCDARLIGWYGVAIASDQILSNADRALALDANLAEAHAARADALSFTEGHEPAEVVAGFERALALDRDSFDANFLYARYCTRTGVPDKAVPLYVRALELHPGDYVSPAMLETIYQSAGQFDQAERYGLLAVKRAEEAIRNHPDWSRPAQLAAATLAGIGRREEALRWLDRALSIDPDDSQTLYNAACVFSRLGEPDKAFAMLERWLPKAGIEKRMWLRNDGDFDPMRNDPRFVRLLAESEATLTNI